MDSILYIKSSFMTYSLCLKEKSKEVIFFKCHTFPTRTNKLKEFQNLALENTMLLIESAQNNAISNIGVEFSGPLGFSPINIQLLKTYGISIIYIKDKTPIHHNGCRPQRRIRIKERSL